MLPKSFCAEQALYLHVLFSYKLEQLVQVAFFSKVLKLFCGDNGKGLTRPTYSSSPNLLSLSTLHLHKQKKKYLM